MDLVTAQRRRRSDLPIGTGRSLCAAARPGIVAQVNLLSFLGWMKTPAGNNYSVSQRWGVAGGWIWFGGGVRGTAQSYQEAVMQATYWADQRPSRKSRRRSRR